ncbi:MAG: hypothetical protein CFE43_06055 [Burkholderiales bacterium PBB3]|nr:MAG: hypothetical protein CFE43_06055 [Burkholderiales bacterium PBB3]
MSEWSPILVAAKRSLVTLGIVAVVSAAAVFALQMWADTLKVQVAQLEAAVQGQRSQLATKQEDLRNVSGHIKRFEALRTQGLVGDPDRPLWVEELQASHGRLGLTTPLVYRLLIPKLVADTNAGTAAPAAVPAEGAASEPQFHDLQFEVRETHEEELLRLIQDYRAHVVGRFRVNACSFAEPKDTGMTAQCVLRFVTIPAPKAAASAAAQ